MKRCRSCRKLHKERWGITNSAGFFCSFLHAFNFARGRTPDAWAYNSSDRFGDIGHGPEPMDKEEKKAQQLRMLKQNKNRIW